MAIAALRMKILIAAVIVAAIGIGVVVWVLRFVSGNGRIQATDIASTRPRE